MVAAALISSAVIGAGGSILSGSEQAGAANDATKDQMSMYNQTRSDLQPFMQGGSQAFSQLGNLLGLNGGFNSGAALSQLRNYPGYQFALQQGQQGLDRTAASRGLLLSGGQLKDSMNYNQGMADQLFGTYTGQLSGLATMGEDAAAKTGIIGGNAAQGAANSMMQAGTYAASGIGGAVNNIGGILSNQSLMGQIFGNGDVYGVTGSAPSPLTVGATLSDRRMKTDVKRIGTLDSGLPVYGYRYKGSNLPQIGVMADEVKVIAPRAVRRMPSGYDAVRYDLVSQLPPMRKVA